MITRKLIRSITRMTRMTRTTRKISMEIEMTVKSLEEVVKVIIPTITPPLSLFPKLRVMKLVTLTTKLTKPTKPMIDRYLVD